MAEAKAPAGWEAYLEPDETILWQGRPDPRWSWRGGENGTLILGAFVLGFLIFAVLTSAPGDGEARIFPLLIWALFAVALGVSGPLAMQMVRRGTWYTLTSRRAVIAHWPTIAGVTVYRGLDCYPINQVARVRSDVASLETVQFSWLSQRRTFLEDWHHVRLHTSGNGGGYRRDHAVGFERLSDGAKVEALCRSVLEAHSA
jgi:hypothetical protein